MGSMSIKAFNEELVWDTYEWIWAVSIIMLPKQSGTKNKAILSKQQLCMYCYVVLSKVFELFRDLLLSTMRNSYFLLHYSAWDLHRRLHSKVFVLLLLFITPGSIIVLNNMCIPSTSPVPGVMGPEVDPVDKLAITIQ